MQRGSIRDVSTPRDVVFVSHANPEDNEFARWLTLKLANLGYRVWCDVTRLLGGEDFWDDIEKAIRDDATKVLFVLSRASNHKAGSLNELKVAQSSQKKNKLSDFVIPVRVDDLPFDETNIELSRLNAVDFSTGWATGLKQLVAKLEKDHTPKDARFGPGAVTAWWEHEAANASGLGEADEPHLSNWFRIQLPQQIYIHTLGGLFAGDPIFEFPTLFRNGLFQNGLLTFAPAADLTAGLGTLQVQATVQVPTNDFLNASDHRERTENRNSVTRFIRSAWELFAASRGLNAYQMANHHPAFYFDSDNLKDTEVKFTGVGGRASRRALMGYKTTLKGKRHWHFGVSAQPSVHPEPLLMFKNHVVFSDDGTTLWDSPERMHKARRSQCKQWWNDDWRDRQLASIAWLAGENATLDLPLGATVFGHVSLAPIEFISPVKLDEKAHAKKADAEGAAMPDMDAAEGIDDEDDEDSEEESIL